MPDARIALLRDNCESLLVQLTETPASRVSEPASTSQGLPEFAAATSAYLASLSSSIPATTPLANPASMSAHAEACENARRLGERYAAGQRSVEDLLSQLLQAARPSGRNRQRQLEQQTHLLAAGVKAYLDTLTRALTEQAQRDALTGLLNRAVFEQQFREELARAQRYRREFTLVLFDLDRFKQVNDQLGHLAGDAVLQHFAEFLRVSLRQSDKAFRYGGDEFAALLPETGGAAAQHVLERLAQRWLETGRRPNSPTAVSVSYGLAAYPRDAANGAELLKTADARLYEHKHRHLRN